jgi:hypothetical protein
MLNSINIRLDEGKAIVSLLTVTINIINVMQSSMNYKLVTVYKEPAVALFKHYTKLYVRTLEDHVTY